MQRYGISRHDLLSAVQRAAHSSAMHDDSWACGKRMLCCSALAVLAMAGCMLLSTMRTTHGCSRSRGALVECGKSSDHAKPLPRSARRGNRPTLAVALSFATPAAINHARRHWLSMPHAAAGDATEPSCHIVHVPTQSQLPGNFSNYNHPTDNRQLSIVRLANATVPRVDWLLVGDPDTCFLVENVRNVLSAFDASVPLLLGTKHAKPGGKEASTGVVQQAPAWPYGGHGFAISRGLLDRVAPAEWLFCEADLHNFGSDVRVACCIFHFTGVVVSPLPGPLGVHPRADGSKDKRKDGHGGVCPGGRRPNQTVSGAAHTPPCSRFP